MKAMSESVNEKKEKKGEEEELELWRVEQLIQVLSYFAAQKVYIYVDSLTNALDVTTAVDTINNALRDYKSNCIDRVSREGEIPCPNIDLDKLELSVKHFNEIIDEFNKRPSDVILFFRRMALKALADSYIYAQAKKG